MMRRYTICKYVGFQSESNSSPETENPERYILNGLIRQSKGEIGLGPHPLTFHEDTVELDAAGNTVTSITVCIDNGKDALETCLPEVERDL